MTLSKKTSQNQQAGENSENYQIGKNYYNYNGATINLNIGGSKEEIANQLIQLLEHNFPKLSEQASELAIKRAEELVNKFLADFVEQRIPLETLKDPDMQFMLIEGQKTFARSGSKEKGDLLLNLLLDRASERGDSFRKIILNEAIGVISKLNSEHLNALSMLLVVRHYLDPDISSMVEIMNYINTYVIPFTINLPYNSLFYDHLTSTGCCYTNNVTEGLGECFVDNYPLVLRTKFPIHYLKFHLKNQAPELETLVFRPEVKGHYFFRARSMNELKNQIRPLLYLFPGESEEQILQKCLNVTKVDRMTSQQAEGFLIKRDNRIEEVARLWNNTSLSRLFLNPVGKYLATINIKRKLSIDLSGNFSF